MSCLHITVVFELCSAVSEFQPLFDLRAFICTDTVYSALGKASVLLSNPLQGDFMATRYYVGEPRKFTVAIKIFVCMCVVFHIYTNMHMPFGSLILTDK